MSAIYAIIPIAQLPDMNRALDALGWGNDVFGGELTTDDPATLTSPITHGHFYNAAAASTDFSMLSAAKNGTLPTVDMNGNPVSWGIGSVISEAEAVAAFAYIQIWANDSDRQPTVFAAEQRAGLGINMRPVDL